MDGAAAALDGVTRGFVLGSMPGARAVAGSPR